MAALQGPERRSLRNRKCKKKVKQRSLGQVKVIGKRVGYDEEEKMQDRSERKNLWVIWRNCIYLSRIKERYLQNSLMQCKAMVMQVSFWKENMYMKVWN